MAGGIPRMLTLYAQTLSYLQVRPQDTLTHVESAALRNRFYATLHEVNRWAARAGVKREGRQVRFSSSEELWDYVLDGNHERLEFRLPEHAISYKMAITIATVAARDERPSKHPHAKLREQDKSAIRELIEWYVQTAQSFFDSRSEGSRASGEASLPDKFIQTCGVLKEFLRQQSVGQE